MEQLNSPFFRIDISKTASVSPLFRHIKADQSPVTAISPLFHDPDAPNTRGFRKNSNRSTTTTSSTHVGPLVLENADESSPLVTHASSVNMPIMHTGMSPISPSIQHHDHNHNESRTRHPPVTRLERLGSCETWCALMIPAMLALGLLAFPSFSSQQLVSFQPYFTCPTKQLTCNTWYNEGTNEGSNEGSNEGVYSFTFNTSPLLLSDIDVTLLIPKISSISIPSSASTTNSNTTYSTNLNMLNVSIFTTSYSTITPNLPNSYSAITPILTYTIPSITISNATETQLHILHFNSQKLSTLLSTSNYTLSFSLQFIGSESSHASSLFQVSTLQVKYGTWSEQVLLCVFQLIGAIVVGTAWIIQILVGFRAAKVLALENKRPLLENVIPEQLFAVFLVFGLLLQQNIFQSIHILFSLININIPKELLIINEICSHIGTFIILFSIYLLICGLSYISKDEQNKSHCMSKFPRHLNRNSEQYLDSFVHSTTNNDMKMNSNNNIIINNESSLIFRNISHTNVFIKTYLPAHHPCASYSSDIYIPKIFILFIFLLFPIYIGYLKNNYLINKNNNYILVFTVWIPLCYICMYGLWISSIVYALECTRKILKKSKHLHSRFRQLTFQMLLHLLTLCLVLVLGYTYQAFHQFIYDVKYYQISTSSHSIYTFITIINLFQYNITPFLNEYFLFNIQIYIECSILLIAYVLSPPSVVTITSSTQGVELQGTSHVYVALQRHVHDSNRSFNSTRLHSKPPRLVFCLELSCYLLECSWQAYYLLGGDDASNTTNNNNNNNSNIYPNTRIDLGRLGLTFENEFYSHEECTTGYLAKAKNKLVLSFRGSVGSKNILKSLDASQESLPNFILTSLQINKFLIDNGLILNNNNFNFNMHMNSNYSNQCDLESPLLHPHTNPCENSSKLSSMASFSARIISIVPGIRQTLPRVHRGFLAAYSSLRIDIIESLVLAIYSHVSSSNCSINDENNSSIPPLSIHFSGHSLGGTLAVLAAYELSINMSAILACISTTIGVNIGTFTPSIIVYTYGTPRIGNSAFASLISSRLRNYYRIEIDGDLIPMLPRFLGWYVHAGVQVLLDADCMGSILVRPTVVESLLLRSSTGNISNHTLSKYRDGLEACFEVDELEEYLQKECKEILLRDASNTPSVNSSGSNQHDLPEWLHSR